MFPRYANGDPDVPEQLAGHADELKMSSLSEEKRRVAGAIEELLKVARLGERNRRRAPGAG